LQSYLFTILAIIKKTISIFLIVLLGFNSFGLFIFYWGEIQLCKIKSEAYSDSDYSMPEKSFTVFSSDTKGIELINKKEIRANGKLYDIVKTELSNGITKYYTLHDEDEDEDVQNLSDWGKNNSQENSLPGKTINLHLEKYFTAEKNHNSITTSSLHNSSHLKTARDYFFYNSPLKNIFSPPPNYFLS
jgi:hypothetical protein